MSTLQETADRIFDWAMKTNPEYRRQDRQQQQAMQRPSFSLSRVPSGAKAIILNNPPAETMSDLIAQIHIVDAYNQATANWERNYFHRHTCPRPFTRHWVQLSAFVRASEQ
jgi:hypothetical protein